jgi:sulfide dehydrogenase cytochrome subunit
MKHIPICLLLVVLSFSTSGFGAELDALTPECDSCHGPQGVSANNDVPTIAGQTSEYISRSLASYQVWGRPCIKSAYRHGDTARPVTTMCKITEEMGVEEMEALGGYYAEKAFVAATQDFNPELALTGAGLHESNCETCHPQGGSVSGQGPILAGQWVSYLKTAIRQSSTGEHLVPPLMERKLTDFSPEEIDALVNFFASQQ